MEKPSTSSSSIGMKRPSTAMPLKSSRPESSSTASSIASKRPSVVPKISTAKIPEPKSGALKSARGGAKDTNNAVNGSTPKPVIAPGIKRPTTSMGLKKPTETKALATPAPVKGKAMGLKAPTSTPQVDIKNKLDKKITTDIKDAGAKAAPTPVKRALPNTGPPAAKSAETDEVDEIYKNEDPIDVSIASRKKAGSLTS